MKRFILSIIFLIIIIGGGNLITHFIYNTPQNNEESTNINQADSINNNDTIINILKL